MKGKELLLIAISSFILTVIWISSNVYHAYATSTLDSLLQAQIQPISPIFDMGIISKLKERTVINPQTVAITPEPTTDTPTPTPTPDDAIDELLIEEGLNPSITVSPTPQETEELPLPTEVTPSEIPTVTP